MDWTTLFKLNLLTYDQLKDLRTTVEERMVEEIKIARNSTPTSMKMVGRLHMPYVYKDQVLAQCYAVDSRRPKIVEYFKQNNQLNVYVTRNTGMTKVPQNIPLLVVADYPQQPQKLLIDPITWKFYSCHDHHLTYWGTIHPDGSKTTIPPTMIRLLEDYDKLPKDSPMRIPIGSKTTQEYTKEYVPVKQLPTRDNLTPARKTVHRCYEGPTLYELAEAQAKARKENADEKL